mmetsp:Transcript_126666/g.370087  ORF Transcript_126666/g.370087 Transcript_126666/m.370087 type:complete len:205 (+) Transcript_126666:492-1106(+)
MGSCKKGHMAFVMRRVLRPARRVLPSDPDAAPSTRSVAATRFSRCSAPGLPGGHSMPASTSLLAPSRLLADPRREELALPPASGEVWRLNLSCSFGVDADVAGLGLPGVSASALPLDVDMLAWRPDGAWVPSRVASPPLSSLPRADCGAASCAIAAAGARSPAPLNCLPPAEANRPRASCSFSLWRASTLAWIPGFIILDAPGP